MCHDDFEIVAAAAYDNPPHFGHAAGGGIVPTRLEEFPPDL
jgi:hypothetical protein